jgi:hypothetical protein
MSNDNTSNFLDSMPDLDIELTPVFKSDIDRQEASQQLVEINGIDPRLKLLSHSSRSTLHKCPRKFQLYRLNSMAQESEEDATNSYDQLTFDYGTVVGYGIQSIMEDKDLDTIILQMFLQWNVDFNLRNVRQSKSFPEAVLAVQKFKHIRDEGYLQEYELLTYGEDNKPAIELSFKINLPEGFSYRGYIDVVLRHVATGEIVVLELKTTSYREVNPAQYKNSGQGLGYSVILDRIAPELSSYTILYLVYSTSRKEFTEFPFEKTSEQRAVWLTGLLVDCKHIELYEAFGVYSYNGDFCYDFYRECEYLGLCTLDTKNLVKPLTVDVYNKLQEKEVYDFEFNFSDLVETQIEKLEES